MESGVQGRAEQPAIELRHMLLLALGVVVVLTVFLALALWHLRVNTLESHSRELRVVALAVSDEIQRGLQGTEAGMRALRVEVALGQLIGGGANGEQTLPIRAALMPQVQSLWLMAADGRVLAASDDAPAPDVKSFFPDLDYLGDEDVAISRPFGARRSTGTGAATGTGVAEPPPLVGMAVPFVGAGRRGWIVASLPVSTLLGAFAAASQAPDARMAVFREDGVRLAGTIVAAPSLDDTTRARRFATAKALELRRFSDGAERIVSLTTLPRYDLRLVLTRNWTAALEPWREFARVAVIGMASIIVVMALLIAMMRRAAREQVRARQALQTALTRASRLESLGALAGGVAHDFNNVLAAVMGFAEMARDAAAAGSRQARQLDRVLQGAQRGKSLAERILAFSRGGARQATVFELEPVIVEVLALLAAAMPAGVVVERQLQAAGARLRGDPAQIFEAVMNLCTNGLQAMPDGGMLSLELTRERVGTARTLSHMQLAAGSYLVLAVADQGCGIAPDVMEHLFEPFFTRRSGATGTGLGLAVVFGAMSEIGGAIDVQSVAGQGARFALYLPESTEALTPVAAAPLPAHAGAGERILVVDDQPELVSLAEEMLTGLHYQVTGYTDAAAALQALREQPQRYAAVITDEAMPGLTGTELTRGLRSFAPRLPVLLISGYGGAALAERAQAAGVSRVLAKPLARDELAKSLAELLEQASAPLPELLPPAAAPD